MVSKNQENIKKESDDRLICSIKNCHAEIEPGQEVKIDGKIYCRPCGTLIITNSLGF